MESWDGRAEDGTLRVLHCNDNNYLEVARVPVMTKNWWRILPVGHLDSVFLQNAWKGVKLRGAHGLWNDKEVTQMFMCTDGDIPLNHKRFEEYVAVKLAPLGNGEDFRLVMHPGVCSFLLQPLFRNICLSNASQWRQALKGARKVTEAEEHELWTYTFKLSDAGIEQGGGYKGKTDHFYTIDAMEEPHRYGGYCRFDGIVGYVYGTGTTVVYKVVSIAHSQDTSGTVDVGVDVRSNTLTSSQGDDPSPPGTAAFYRYFNEETGDHYYTIDRNEGRLMKETRGYRVEEGMECCLPSE